MALQVAPPWERDTADVEALRVRMTEKYPGTGSDDNDDEPESECEHEYRCRWCRGMTDDDCDTHHNGHRRECPHCTECESDNHDCSDCGNEPECNHEFRCTECEDTL